MGLSGGSVGSLCVRTCVLQDATNHCRESWRRPPIAVALSKVIASCHCRSLLMIPTITAFERSPDRGRGLARDMRVRWALEEVGQPYEVRLVSFSEMKEPAHRRLHPVGQIPTYEEGDLVLFESVSYTHLRAHETGRNL